MTELSIPRMIRERAQRYGGKTALRVKRDGAWRDISWSDLSQQVDEAALGLIDLEIERGDRVAILSEGRPEWVVADLAILSAGAVTVPVYTTLTAQEIEHILRHSGARLLFASHPDLMAKVIHLQKELGLKVVLFDAPYRVAGPRVWWMGELLGLGRTADAQQKRRLAERLEQIRADDLASLIYTSGTTGPPKGVMLSHGNFLSNCAAVAEVFPMGETDLTLSFLPLSHVFERMAGYYFVLHQGGTIAYAESLEAVPQNLTEVRPTVVTGVPRFYEKMHERILAAVRASPGLRQAVFRWALRAGTEASRLRLAEAAPGASAHRLRMQGRHPPGLLALQHRLADRLVFSKIRHRLGGRIKFCVSGSAPLSRQIAEFFHAVGILILEGYGLTETSPVITVNRPDRFRLGTVGVPLPGVEVRIAEDGEILTRGPHVMKGYFQNPAATAEVMDPEGWFRTGDVGTLSADGFLTITDRKKDLLKTSGGKMVAPQNLEAALKSDPAIADCVVVGDRRKYISALVVPNPEKLKELARRLGLPASDPEGLVRHPEVISFVWERVQKLNQTLASFEQIKKVTLLSGPFTLGSGELTPTLKVKRRVIAEKYAAQIEAMYQD